MAVVGEFPGFRSRANNKGTLPEFNAVALRLLGD
jgi:hypothetical protein